ncbi:hypothetical protein BEH94_06230 [Candidatus Altiarchaeales archaeon WOR_SM1_SCG]|nr:hypothetical protein BEH94_06230 [Candidatus Altiarchaeales archaeon WOR_SM1_SCG]
MQTKNKIKAKLFNKKASDPKNKPQDVLDSLRIEKGSIIADIGAGGGYFTLRFADAVGEKGKVYAIDTDHEFLEFIRKSAEEKVLDNVETVIAAGDNLNLPEGTLDLIFVRNVYHHLQNRVEYFRKLKILLKPEGRVAVIEYKPGGFFSFHAIFGHYVKREVIAEEMGKAGYRVDEKFDFLPEQSFTIFALTKS